MKNRKLFVRIACVVAPLALQVIAACSASNGNAIPAEVRDADSIDAGNNNSSGGNGNGNEDDDSGSGKKDGASPKDSGDPTTDANDDGGPGLPVVIINEIYVDHDALGDGAEWVELRADPGTPVNDLKLRLINYKGTVTRTVDVGPANAKVPASGLWVVGGGQSFQTASPSHEDTIDTLASGWGLDNERGAVQLVRSNNNATATATLLDVVGWSDDPDAGVGFTVVGAPPLAAGEGMGAVTVPTISRPNAAPKTAHSFGRKAAAADTNDNKADFCSMPATPGYAQKACD